MIPSTAPLPPRPADHYPIAAAFLGLYGCGWLALAGADDLDAWLAPAWTAAAVLYASAFALHLVAGARISAWTR